MEGLALRSPSLSNETRRADGLTSRSNDERRTPPPNFALSRLPTDPRRTTAPGRVGTLAEPGFEEIDSTGNGSEDIVGDVAVFDSLDMLLALGDLGPGMEGMALLTRAEISSAASSAAARSSATGARCSLISATRFLSSIPLAWD